MMMPDTDKSYRLTLALDTSTSASEDFPVQVVAHRIRQDSCYTAQISYAQAGLLLVKTFHKPTLIRQQMDALLKYELVALGRAPDDPHLFSSHELSMIGVTLDSIQNA